MVELLSFLMGSTFTIFGYQLYRVCARTIPYLTPPRNMSLLANNWVIVGGSTDGIGKEYVSYLSEQNCRIIALGRNKKKLEEIKEKFGQTQCVQIDFSEQTLNDSTLQQVHKAILNIIKQSDTQKESKVIGFINSVGMSHFSTYNSLTNSQILKMHNTNVGSLHFMLKLSNLMLKSKAQLEQTQTPFFINISSAVAKHPHRYSIVYAATKAYLSNLVEGFCKQNQKVTFLDVRPWYVKTKMVSFQNTWDVVQPREVVDGSFKVLGKKPYCSGTLKHQLIDEFQWIYRDHFSKRIQQMMQRLQKMKSLRKKKKQ